MKFDGDPTYGSQEPVSVSEKEEILKRVNRVNIILADDTVSLPAKQRIAQLDVLCTISGFRPVSYLQFPSDESGLMQMEDGDYSFTTSDAEQFKALLAKFGVESQQLLGGTTLSKGGFLFLIYEPKTLIETVAASRLFSAKEKGEAKKDPDAFVQGIFASELPSAKAKKGVLQGHPENDAIEFADSRGGERGKGKWKDIVITGRFGRISWLSSNPDSPEAKKAKARFHYVNDLANDLLTAPVPRSHSLADGFRRLLHPKRRPS